MIAQRQDVPPALSAEHPSPGPTRSWLGQWSRSLLGQLLRPCAVGPAIGVTDGLGTGMGFPPKRVERVKVKKMTGDINEHMTSTSNW